jgi:tetratricopeptide (TPR) repeat protein
MQANIPLLEKKAIKLALTENWQEAIAINQEILHEDTKNLKAKIRLGRAYLQTKDFKKAEKLFKEVLNIDPINQVAKKNYELAKNQRSEQTPRNINGFSLVKEPGTTAVTTALISARGVTANSFSYGQELEIKPLKDTISILTNHKPIGEVTDIDIIKRVNQATRLQADLSITYLKGQDKEISVLITSSIPVFKAEKQDVKPYMRKGSLDEPELEIESYDDIDEE